MNKVKPDRNFAIIISWTKKGIRFLVAKKSNFKRFRCAVLIGEDDTETGASDKMAELKESFKYLLVLVGRFGNVQIYYNFCTYLEFKEIYLKSRISEDNYLTIKAKFSVQEQTFGNCLLLTVNDSDGGFRAFLTREYGIL